MSSRCCGVGDPAMTGAFGAVGACGAWGVVLTLVAGGVGAVVCCSAGMSGLGALAEMGPSSLYRTMGGRARCRQGLLPAPYRALYIRPAALGPTPGGNVDLSIAGANLVYAFGGMILMFLGFWIFDKITPRVDFPTEIGKGNLAVAIIIAALFVSLAYIIGRSLN